MDTRARLAYGALALVGVGLVVGALWMTAGDRGGAPQAPRPLPAASQEPQPQERTIEVGGTVVRVAIADTPEKRSRGLSGRTGLAPDEGMLFIFPQEGVYAFWMKDMAFSIDIIWLAASGTIVGLWENVAPDTYPRSYAPAAPARFVLELPAGFAQKYDVRVGDAVQL